MLLRICVWSTIAASFLSAETLEESLAVFPPTFPARITLATSYLESGDLRRAEETLLEAGRLQTNSMSDLAAAVLANAWGCLHLKQERFKQARAEFTGALNRISGNAGGWPLTPTLLDNLTAAEIGLALYPQALIHQQEAVRSWLTRLPASHPKLIKSYATLANIQYMSNNADAADASMRTAIDSARRAYGDRGSLLADLLESHAIILRRLGLKRDARAEDAEARHIRGPNNAEPAALTVDAKTLMRAGSLACR